MKSGRQALPRGCPEFYKVARVPGNLDGDGNFGDGGEIIHTSVFLLLLVDRLFVVLVASFLGGLRSRGSGKKTGVLMGTFTWYRLLLACHFQVLTP